jgi:hypothetical protein
MDSEKREVVLKVISVLEQISETQFKVDIFTPKPGGFAAK